MRDLRNILMLMVGVWVGLVLGLSFIEAPLKFTAPGITTKLGLGIGKIIFSVSNKIQGLFLVVLLLSWYLQLLSFTLLGRCVALILIIIMGLQTVVILPILDHRADLIMEGKHVLNSSHHIYFVFLEILKVVALILIYFNIIDRK